MESLEIQVYGECATRNVAVDYSAKLDAGEKLLAVSPPVELGSNDLSFSAQQVSQSDLTINGRLVPTGMAAQFQISGGTAGQQYRVRMEVATDATVPGGQVFCDVLRFKVVE